MQKCGTQNLALAVLLVTTLVVLTSARSLTLKEKRGTNPCRDRACAWAICPYRNIPGPSYPEEDECTIIPNRSCRCTNAYGCQLTDIMEPGRVSVRYEYRCMDPQIPREIFQIGRRRRQAPSATEN